MQNIDSPSSVWKKAVNYWNRSGLCPQNTVRCAASAGIGEDRKKIVTVFSTMFSKLVVEIMADLVKDRVQQQGFVPPPPSVHLYEPGIGLVLGEYTTNLQDYVEEGNSICDEPVLRNQFERVFARDRFGPSWVMQHSFMLIFGDGEETAVFMAAKVLQLFPLSPQTDSGGTKFLFLQNAQCTGALNEMNKELDCVRLR